MCRRSLFNCATILILLPAITDAYLSLGSNNRHSFLNKRCLFNRNPSHNEATAFQPKVSAQPKSLLLTTLLAKKANKAYTMKNMSDHVLKVLCTTAICLLLQSTDLASSPALAANYYGALSEEQKVVAEAWRLIDNSYLDRTFNGQDWFATREKYVKNTKYKSQEDVQAAITAITESLGDKYTRYLSPAKYQSIVNSATGTLAGTGVEISVDKKTGQIYASDIQENSPASRGGILPGDIFVEVDGTRFLGDKTATPDDVAAKLRGPKGTRVNVVMQRKDEKFDLILTREPITITSVRSYMSNMPSVGKVGVIRIKSFSSTTAQLVTEKFNQLKKDGAKAFVVDVRGNPGGLLPGGVDTASLFLEVNKPVVFVVSKTGIVDSQSTLADGIDIESPLVILVDSATASAAEVFTAALQENNRATVAGEQTFGKGIVQTIRELRDGNGGLSITVARYETPQHHDINKQGIPVNVQTPVDCPKDNAVLCLTPSVFSKT